jgi:hypothetical protein
VLVPAIIGGSWASNLNVSAPESAYLSLTPFAIYCLLAGPAALLPVNR